MGVWIDSPRQRDFRSPKLSIYESASRHSSPHQRPLSIQIRRVRVGSKNLSRVPKSACSRIMKNSTWRTSPKSASAVSGASVLGERDCETAAPRPESNAPKQCPKALIIRYNGPAYIVLCSRLCLCCSTTVAYSIDLADRSAEHEGFLTSASLVLDVVLIQRVMVRDGRKVKRFLKGGYRVPGQSNPSD